MEGAGRTPARVFQRIRVEEGARASQADPFGQSDDVATQGATDRAYSPAVIEAKVPLPDAVAEKQALPSVVLPVE